MGKRQRTPEDIEKHRAVTQEQMQRGAKPRGLLALVSTTSDSKKRIEFVNRDFHATISIRGCAVLEKRPALLTLTNFIRQPLRVALCNEKVNPVVVVVVVVVVGGHSKTTARRLRAGMH